MGRSVYKPKTGEYEVDKLYRLQRELGAHYAHKIADLINNDKYRERDDGELYRYVSELEEGCPTVGKSYISEDCYESVRNMFSEFYGCYRAAERSARKRGVCKRSRTRNSNKKKRGILEGMQRCEKSLAEIQRQREQWDTQLVPNGVYQNVRKMSATMCSLRGFRA